jgi:hypothetical protein
MPEMARPNGHARRQRRLVPFSFIRTLTVGSGVAPDLLTSRVSGALAGLALLPLPPVGNFTPP